MAIDEDVLKSEASATVQPLEHGAGLDHDSRILARAGKKQVLKRRFNQFTMFSLACVALTSWEFAVNNLGIGLKNGGPAGLIYAVIVNAIGLGAVYLSIAELASMAPTSGGQYHWTSFLAPSAWRVQWSYLTGWLTVISWTTNCAGTAFFAASVIQTVIQFANPSYEAQQYYATLIMWALLLFSFILNTASGSWLPLIELTFLSLHLIGFFAYLIPLVSLGPPGNAHEIFTRFNNGGGFQTDGLSFMVGLQGTVICFLGFDCVVHMSEEVEKSDVSVSRAIVSSFAINTVMVFSIVLVFLYRAGNFDDLFNSDSPYLFIPIVYTATGSTGATVALASYTIFMAFACLVTSIAAGSRMYWSFARDRGLPFSAFLHKIEPKTRLPIMSILTLSVIAAVLGLINIGSTVAFYAFTSLTTAGFCSSYLCVLILLLYHRVKGNIERPMPGCSYDMHEKPTGERQLVFGPWHIPGIPGILNTSLACAYLVISIFFSFWPTVKDVTAETFNFAVAIYAGALILSGIYYAFWARKSFNGPIVEIVL